MIATRASENRTAVDGLCRRRGKHRFRNKVDLAGLVREMLQLVMATITKNAVLKIDVPSNVPRIRGNAAQIRQVDMNLITNASDALGEQRWGDFRHSDASSGAEPIVRKARWGFPPARGPRFRMRHVRKRSKLKSSIRFSQRNVPVEVAWGWPQCGELSCLMAARLECRPRSGRVRVSKFCCRSSGKLNQSSHTVVIPAVPTGSESAIRNDRRSLTMKTCSVYRSQACFGEKGIPGPGSLRWRHGHGFV